MLVFSFIIFGFAPCLESSFHLNSVQFSCSVMSNSLWPHGPQHTKLPCPSLSLRICSDSCLLSDDANQPSHPLLLFSPPSPPAFSLSQHQGLFQWLNSLHQVAKVLIGTSTSVLSVNIQGWFPLELTGLISLQSKGLSRVFFNTAVQKDQFLGTQPCLWSNIHDYCKNHTFDYAELYWQSDVSAF